MGHTEQAVGGPDGVALAELGVPPPAVRPLPVGEVAPGVAVQGPVPGLNEQVRALHRRFRS